MSLLDINYSAMLSFIVLFDTVALKAKLSSLELPRNSPLKLVGTEIATTAKEIMNRVELKSLWRTSALNELQFLES